MFTRIAQRSIIFPSHHAFYQAHPLPQMHNLALNQQFCILRRWSQIRAIERSCNVTQLPESLARNRCNWQGRRGIEDRGNGTTVKITSRIAQVTRDFEGECAAANVAIGFGDRGGERLEVRVDYSIEEL